MLRMQLKIVVHVMDGACVYEMTRTDGKWKMRSFFLDFWPLMGPLPARGCKFFDYRSVYLNLS